MEKDTNITQRITHDIQGRPLSESQQKDINEMFKNLSEGSQKTVEKAA